jgi:hypothetical protein
VGGKVEKPSSDGFLFFRFLARTPEIRQNHSNMFSFLHKHHLTFRVLPSIVVVVIAKYVLMHYGWQPLPLTALVTAVVSAGVFLLGFLISGSLSDYKEAERLPSEIAASLDALTDESLILRMTKPESSVPNECLQRLLALSRVIDVWFHKKAPTGDVMAELRKLNESFAAFEPLTQANFIVRMKQEQQSLRRYILRIRTIREVSFVVAAYAIGELFTVFVVLVLLFTDMGDVLESLLFTGGLSFLLVYMIALVKDLDNPFHYHKKDDDGDEVDTAPLLAVQKKIEAELNV